MGQYVLLTVKNNMTVQEVSGTPAQQSNTGPADFALGPANRLLSQIYSSVLSNSGNHWSDLAQERDNPFYVFRSNPEWKHSKSLRNC
ncbi:hypothetical protein TNCV_1814831 [Trichonephila clavipes]|nr:hypothetical protein TNCV_1814831 [Trichonephila clavipes]